MNATGLATSLATDSLISKSVTSMINRNNATGALNGPTSNNLSTATSSKNTPSSGELSSTVTAIHVTSTYIVANSSIVVSVIDSALTTASSTTVWTLNLTTNSAASDNQTIFASETVVASPAGLNVSQISVASPSGPIVESIAEPSIGVTEMSTTTALSVTGTVTSIPSGFLDITLPGTSYRKNGWITTTDKHSHATLLPFLVVGGGRGIAFWDLPDIPRIEFAFPGLPHFHLPCIKIFGISVGTCTLPPETDSGGSETENRPSTKATASRTSSTTTSRKASSSSDLSCTASTTVSDCMVSCVSPASVSSCASYQTTCSQTVTGCSLSGTTSTVTSTDACLIIPATNIAQVTQTFCNAGCSPDLTFGTEVPPITTSPPDPNPDFKKRGIAGRITMDPIHKRGQSVLINNLGGCQLATARQEPLTQPGWPSINVDMIPSDMADDMPEEYSEISRYDRATRVGCVMTTTRLSARQFHRAPSWMNLEENNFNNRNDAASLDHACK